jgi:hypothetical protein
MPFTEKEILSGYKCPVCGFTMKAPPAEFNVCPSCGTEFGNDDVDWTIEQLREAWIERGAQWWSNTQPAPEGWNPVEQLLCVIPIAISSAAAITIAAYPSYVQVDPNSSTWACWKTTGTEAPPCRA